jgi:hypothetical protein
MMTLPLPRVVRIVIVAVGLTLYEPPPPAAYVDDEFDSAAPPE